MANRQLSPSVALDWRVALWLDAGQPLDPSAGYGTEARGSWQVIFRTATGQDYCRETKRASMSLEALALWAGSQIAQNSEIASAVIERW